MSRAQYLIERLDLSAEKFSQWKNKGIHPEDVKEFTSGIGVGTGSLKKRLVKSAAAGLAFQAGLTGVGYADYKMHHPTSPPPVTYVAQEKERVHPMPSLSPLRQTPKVPDGLKR